MRFEEKLRREMVLKGFNQQRLARASGVSDSEVSRILAGKSQPGLENALKLARAVGISLDYLADDTQEANPDRPTESDPWVTEALELVRELGPREAVQLLLAVRTIGHEMALRRLFGVDGAMSPEESAASVPTSIQVDPEPADTISVGNRSGTMRGTKVPRIVGEH